MRLTLASLLLVGCGSSISGKVDGDSVGPLTSGFWYAIGSDDDEVINAVAASFPDACKAYTGFYKAQADAYRDFSGDGAALAEDMKAAEQDNFPSEFWQTTLLLDADPNDDEVVGEYKIDDNINNPDSQAFVDLLHQIDYTDYEAVYLERDDSGYKWDSFYAEGGSIDVKSFRDEGQLRATGEMILHDANDKEAGAIRLNLSVTYCEDVARAYEDFLDVLSGL